tara:strand:+ start:1306 stop:1497 length:192 start_codon:yes stop_codon:yes gene_type:complete
MVKSGLSFGILHLSLLLVVQYDRNMLDPVFLDVKRLLERAEINFSVSLGLGEREGQLKRLLLF